MSKENKSNAIAAPPKNTKTDAGEKELQETFDKANAQGFFGTEIDVTENEAYTLKGVTSGMATPETDASQAALVREHTKMGKSALELNAAKESK